MRNFKHFSSLILVFSLCNCANFTRIDYSQFERGKAIQPVVKSGHQRAVGCLAMTTDSKFIITGSFDKTIKIWLTDGTFVKTINTGAIVNAVAFNPYGNTIIAGLSDKTIQIWTFDGVKLRTITGHNGEITSLAVSPDGGFFVSGSKDKTIKIWDSGGNLLHNILAHEDTVSSVRVTSTFPFREIVSASWDGTIKIWSPFGYLLDTIKDEATEGNYVESMDVSRDGQYIAGGYSDGSIKLWGREGFEIKGLIGNTNIVLLQSFVGHGDYVKCLAISKDNQTLISGSADNSMIIWGTNGNMFRNLRSHSGIVRDIQLFPNGEGFISASADDTVKIWYTNGFLIKTMSFQNSQIAAIAASPDLRSIYTAWDDNSIKTWNTGGQIVRVFRGLKQPPKDMWVTPDNKLVLVNDDNILDIRSSSGNLLGTISGNGQSIHCFAIAPTSEIYAGLSDYSVGVWNSRGGLERQFKAHDNQITAIAVTPNGNNIITASKDMSLKIWSLGGKTKFIYTNLSQEINSIQVSMDSKLFLAELADKSYQLWTMKGTISNTFSDNFASACFSTENGWLVFKRKDDTMVVRDFQGNTKTNLSEIEDIVSMQPLSTSPSKKLGKFIVARNPNNKILIFNALNYSYMKLLFNDNAYFYQDNFGYYDCPRDIVKTTKIAKGFTLYDLEQYDKIFYRKYVYDYFLANKTLTKNNMEALIDNQYTVRILEPQDNISLKTNAVNIVFKVEKENFNIMKIMEIFGTNQLKISPKNFYVKVNARIYKFPKKYKHPKEDPADVFKMKISLNRGDNAIICGYADPAKKVDIRSQKISIFNNK